MRVNVTKYPECRAVLLLLVCACSVAWPAAKPAKVPVTGGKAVLWQEPSNWDTRDLYYGPGGRHHEPRGPYKFVKEDMDGTQAKFVVTDGEGVKWKLKLGLEVRPETAASRLVWAVGYFAAEDYFVRDIRVAGMPQKLHRGQKEVGADGTMHNVRLKREAEGVKKLGTWAWDHSEFTGTREWNGLRTLMAVINNWDLKDVNNAVYRVGDQRIYMVSDLGACFGTAGRTWPPERAKDNLYEYSRSKFIREMNRDTVDFQVPARPQFVLLVDPKAYVQRVRLENLGKDVPRADARWLGQLLAKLAPGQIRDAFRAAGYSPEEVEALADVVSQRIGALTAL